MRSCLVAFMVAGLIFMGACGSQKSDNEGDSVQELASVGDMGGAVIKDGKKVKFGYVLFVEGNIIDKGTMGYTHGRPQIISGLARQLVGLSVGDERTIVVPASEGYGEANPNAVQEMPIARLPSDAKVGMALQMKDRQGRPLTARIIGRNADNFVVDFNHLLAGKELTFEVKILSVE
ncbi:peptidylprolyl isomerase [Thermoproteota archaeon]